MRQLRTKPRDLKLHCGGDSRIALWQYGRLELQCGFALTKRRKIFSAVRIHGLC